MEILGIARDDRFQFDFIRGSISVVNETHLQPRATGLVAFIHVVVTGVVASVFTAHSKRTSVPRMTFMSVGLVTIKVGSERSRY